jgi:hypothetical protein
MSEKHDHVHSTDECLLVVCRRLIPLLEPTCTAAGIKDAEECENNAKRKYGRSHTEMDILLSRLRDLLEDSLVEDTETVQ